MAVRAEAAMTDLIVYYAHPGHRFSRANKSMADLARKIDGIEFVDLYAEYPRHDVDVPREQKRLLDHQVILLQFPVFWYSAPALVKDWIDLVLEHGFAYGAGGDALSGKTLMLAVTAGGPEEAYSSGGYQHYPLRTFLTPFEQTARLCKMHFSAPYVLYGSLRAPDQQLLEPHVSGYGRLLESIRDNKFNFKSACSTEFLRAQNLDEFLEMS